MEKCLRMWWEGGGGLVVERGITSFILRGLGDLPKEKSP